ncbi:MAG: hypothetical protein ABSC72_04050 [Methylovirgula sp.]
MIKIMNFQDGSPRGFGLTSAAIGALMVAALSCPLPVHADGLPNPLANFMGGGTDNGPIDYRPRPALVVPPTNDLPPPQTSSTVPSANWPKAPDTKILNAAKADSRRPAPSEDSQLSGDAANQKVVFQDENECNKVLGMPMCLSGWGQDGGRPKPVVLTTQQRRYLIDPPATYLAAVPMQPGDARYAPPPPSCSTPGWFGCPEQPDTYWKVLGMQPPRPNGAAGGGADPNGAADGGAPPGQIFGQQPPAPQKKCPLGPGWLGCQEQPQVLGPTQAQAQPGTTGNQQSASDDQGPVPPGQVFGQPRAPLQQHCMLNGWFGCQEQ